MGYTNERKTIMERYLNIGCGGTRPAFPWINMDMLFEELMQPCYAEIGRSEPHSLTNLRNEPNYVNINLETSPMPFDADSVDGIFASHVFEHFDCQAALRVLGECLRVLKPGAVLRVGVPDSSIFRRNYPNDNRENCVAIYGEPCHRETFMSYALFFAGHKQILSEDSLWCHLANAGFREVERMPFRETKLRPSPLADLDNREKFTLFMEGVK